MQLCAICNQTITIKLAPHYLLITTQTLEKAKQFSQWLQETIALHTHMYIVCSSALSQS